MHSSVFHPDYREVAIIAIYINKLYQCDFVSYFLFYVCTYSDDIISKMMTDDAHLSTRRDPAHQIEF